MYARLQSQQTGKNGMSVSPIMNEATVRVRKIMPKCCLPLLKPFNNTCGSEPVRTNHLRHRIRFTVSQTANHYMKPVLTSDDQRVLRRPDERPGDPGN